MNKALIVACGLIFLTHFPSPLILLNFLSSKTHILPEIYFYEENINYHKITLSAGCMVRVVNIEKIRGFSNGASIQNYRSKTINFRRYGTKIIAEGRISRFFQIFA